MKKITLLLLFLSITFSVRAQFPESFVDGVIPTGWTTFIGANGLGTTENWSASTGGYMLCFDENAGDFTEDWLVSPSVNITSINSLLSFYEQTLYTDVYEPSNMSVRVSTTSQTDISTFTSLSSLTATEVFNGSNSRSIDLSAYEGKTIYIAWVLEQNYGDGWLIDDISLNNQNATAPSCAENLLPANGNTDVYLTDGEVSLSWDAPSTGDAPTEYEIFWGTTSGSLTSLGSLVGTSVNIINVDYSTTYYWSIVPKNAGGSATGCAELSFTTQADPTLGIKENKIEGLSLFPTIINQNLSITSLKSLDAINVFNLLGQQVYSSKPNTTNLSVDLSSLKAGIYLVKVKVGDSKGTYKIIKE
ncbi:Por secretion system C-terminal sorting domain-containing protein [Polaribacter sp. KT25b]|uniref:T9SS-dependent choice-of-anchor J family protein n=1 Tax=Polaribacter sp. KT25b TaxID=1855336 RepID=UPI00087D1C58|nr:choice-of-anchor J domain-containing protein [Polaribacter sp. KT25b]SDS15119.1 Por secretion system C-terminal sorting domain-containing protein [Polaribacter sp. KT25b]